MSTQGGGDTPQIFEEATPITRDSSGHHYTRTAEEVAAEFAQLNPREISEACVNWQQAASVLGDLANELKTRAAAPLKDAWQSETASPKAQEQLQLAQATAAALADQCMQMAHATDYAARYAEWYKANLPDTSFARSVGATVGAAASNDQVAVDYMTAFLSRYNEVTATLPAEVQAHLSMSAFSVDDDWKDYKAQQAGSTEAGNIPGGGLRAAPDSTTGQVAAPVAGPGQLRAESVAAPESVLAASVAVEASAAAWTEWAQVARTTRAAPWPAAARRVVSAAWAAASAREAVPPAVSAARAVRAWPVAPVVWAPGSAPVPWAPGSAAVRSAAGSWAASAAGWASARAASERVAWVPVAPVPVGSVPAEASDRGPAPAPWARKASSVVAPGAEWVAPPVAVGAVSAAPPPRRARPGATA